MRMFENDEGYQVFDACVLLTREEALNLIGLFEDCIEEGAGCYLHIFDEQEPDKSWIARNGREVTASCYALGDPQNRMWTKWYADLLDDDAGIMEMVDFRSLS